MNLCVPTHSRSGGCAKRPPSTGKSSPHPRPSGGETALRYASDAVAYAIALTQNALSLMRQDEAIEKAYHDAYASDLAGLLDLQARIAQKDWNGLAFACGILPMRS